MKTIGKWVLCLVVGFPLCSYAGMCTNKEGLDLFVCRGTIISVALPSVATIATSAFTKYEILGKMSSNDKRVILKAANDAVLFIATESKQRGVYLQAAIHLLRERVVSYKGLDDYQIAMIIIGFNNENNALFVFP